MSNLGHQRHLTLNRFQIDVWVDASTLSRHNQSTTTALSAPTSTSGQVTRPEEHFYPSSLAFDLICLFDQGFVHASHLGLQRKVHFLLFLVKLMRQPKLRKIFVVNPKNLYFKVSRVKF